MAAEGFFRGVLYEGCISGHDNDVHRRPYHRNCGCAIHDRKESLPCTHRGKSKKVSYPLRRAWSESCLALAAASAHSSPSPSPSSSSPSTTLGNCRPYHHHLGLTNLEEEQD